MCICTTLGQETAVEAEQMPRFFARFLCLSSLSAQLKPLQRGGGFLLEKHKQRALWAAVLSCLFPCA